MKRSLNQRTMGWGFIFAAVACFALSWAAFIIYVIVHFTAKFW